MKRHPPTSIGRAHLERIAHSPAAQVGNPLAELGTSPCALPGPFRGFGLPGERPTVNQHPSPLLIPAGQAEPTGLGLLSLVGHVGEQPVEREPSYERLRSDSNGVGLLERVPPDVMKTFNQAMGAYIVGDAHGLWLEPDSKDGHCDPEELCYSLGTRISAIGDLYNGELIRSPIEGSLVAALLWINVDWAGFPSPDDYFDHDEPVEKEDRVRFCITPQAEVAGYKIDFLLWISFNGERGGIAIECDGHDWHERTKEQATRDKRRDREILAAGYPVVRFTGTEIFRDPLACAEQIAELAAELLHRISKAGGMF